MFRKIIKGLKDVWCGTLEFDTEPKKDSFNPVTSGGVYDAINGSAGAKEIVYFDVDPSDPPSGIYEAIGEALSNNKIPVIKIDGAVYFYTATGTDKYVFVGGYTKESVGYTEIEVSDDDSVTSKSVDDKVFNMYILPQDDPASPGETPSDEDQWVCDADKHVITKDEIVAAHADCRYFILNNAVEPDSNSRKYFASVTVISNSYIRLRFYMMQYDAQGVAEFYQKTVVDDSEGRLYILSSYSATLAGTIQAVLVSEPQDFNSTQKAQGRSNIGAASASDVTELQSQVSSLSDVSAYSVKGEATVAQLNAGPSGIQAGWAYQLTDSGTLTDGSLAVVAGDTVAWDGTKWFPLVKSDYYATKTYAQNVAHSIAPEFDPTRTSENPYKAGESVTYTDGKVYTFKVDHYGSWVAADVEQIDVDTFIRCAMSVIDNSVTRVYDKDSWTETTGKYMTSEGEVTNENTSYYYRAVVPGERYYIKSYTQQVVRLWLMFDAADNLVKESSSGPSDIGEESAVVMIPQGVTKLYVNNRNGASHYDSMSLEKICMSPNAVDKSDVNQKIRALDSNGKEVCINLLRELGITYSYIDDIGSFTLVEGYTINTGKTTYAEAKTENASWNYYEKTVSPGDRFKLKAVAGSVSRLWIFYDSNGYRISRSSDSSDPSTKEEEITAPYGAVKLCVNARNNTSIPDFFPAQISVYKAILPDIQISGYSNYAVPSTIADKIKAVGSDGASKNVNLMRELGVSFGFADDYDNWTEVEGYFLNSTKTTYAEAKTSNAQWTYFEKAVTSGDKFKVKAVAGQSVRLWTIYDYYGNLISCSSDSSTVGTKEEEVVIPPNANKLCVNARNNTAVPDFFPPVLTRYNAFIPKKNVSGLDPSASRSDKMYGKVLVCCGDSITQGADIGPEGITRTSPITSYTRQLDGTFAQDTNEFVHAYGLQIAERHNMIFYNDGIGGTTMQDLTARSFSHPLGRYTTLPDEIDYLTIFFGWNDTADGTLGTIDDEDASESYYGGYNVVLQYLINKYPYTKICLIVPFGCTAGHREAIRLLGNKYGLSVFDMYGPGTPLYFGKEDSVGVLDSVVTANRAKFQATSAHPNFHGQTQIADMLEQHLMGI